MDKKTFRDCNLESNLLKIIASGYQVDLSALSLLKELSLEETINVVVDSVIAFINELPTKPLFITKELLEKHIHLNKINNEQTNDPVSIISSSCPTDSTQLEVLTNTNDTDILADSVEGQLSYFKNRFSKISKILLQRSDTIGTQKLKQILDMSVKEKKKVIILVNEKVQRKNSILLDIEDLENKMTVIVPKRRNISIYEKAQKIIPDQVVCLEITKLQNNLLIANNIIFPDIPDKKYQDKEQDIYVVLTSDIHIGSDKFLWEQFNQFLRWLSKKEGTREQINIAKKVKYIVIAGDLVDGIGVYPDQEKELEIKDIHEQYSTVGKLLSSIPNNIGIIIIPGNHDATRQALPQPSIPETFVSEITRHRSVINLPNPVQIKIHGVNIITYHGTGFNDVIGTIPGITYQNLNESISIAMETLIKARHLAPKYGGRTPIFIQERDHLVIETPPNIFHTGHVHVIGNDMYRGTLLVNSGAWQAQTDYQERMGLNPTPALVPVVNLKDLSLLRLNFL